MKNLATKLKRMTDEEVSHAFGVVSAEKAKRQARRMTVEERSARGRKMWEAKIEGMSPEEIAEMMRKTGAKKKI